MDIPGTKSSRVHSIRLYIHNRPRRFAEGYFMLQTAHLVLNPKDRFQKLSDGIVLILSAGNSHQLGHAISHRMQVLCALSHMS